MTTNTKIQRVNDDTQTKTWDTPKLYCLDIDRSEKIPFFTETASGRGAGS